MSFTDRNRTVHYDNVAKGSVKGPEKHLGAAIGVAVPGDNIKVGSPSPENLENVQNAAGTKSVSPAASGLEIV
jgi:hypothetical protein